MTQLKPITRRTRTWWFVRDTAQHPMATVKWVTCRTVGRAVCSRKGHTGDRITRMLGFCPRCYADLPTTLWTDMAKQREQQT